VLVVVVAVEVTRKALHAAVHQNVVDECCNQILVDLRLAKVLRHRRPVDHRASARVGRVRRLLQVVPVLDDLAILEPENVEADLRAKEVVVGVRENEIAVSEHPYRVHLRRALWQGLQHGAEACKPVTDGKVVLDVLGRVDHGHRCWFTGFNGLE